MNRTRLPHGDRLASLLLPTGTRLVHIGPPKSGTTAIQAALWAARSELLTQDVRVVGRSPNSPRAAQAVTRRAPAASDVKVPPGIEEWTRLVGEFTRAREARTVVSSEHFVWADADAIRRIRDDLGPSRVHVIATLRPLVRVLPSTYQQVIRHGGYPSFETYLERIFRRALGEVPSDFWYLQRHDELLARWADVVGPDHVTAVALDDADPVFLFRVFESLLGLRPGTLQPVPDRSNRSLTLPESEAIRALNAAISPEGLPRSLHLQLLRKATLVMQQREPPADEPRLTIPAWAHECADAVAREMVEAIAASGVHVVGDLSTLVTSRPGGRRDEPRDPEGASQDGPPSRKPTPGPSPADESIPEVAIPPMIAGRMALGVLRAVGRQPARTDAAVGRVRRLARRVTGHIPIEEPLDVARIPTAQLSGIVARRVRHAARERVGRRPPASRA